MSVGYALALALALPAATSAQAVKTVRDLVYAPGSAAHTLDLSVPADARRFGTIVFVHGGSLTSGDKSEDSLPVICTHLARAGIGCASVNYRLGPSATWPAQPQDVAAAIAWLRRNVAARGGDSTKLVLWGHSSGCLIAAVVATDPRYLAAERLSPRVLAGLVPMGCLLEPVLPAVRDSVRLRSYFTGSAGLATFGSLEAFLDANLTAHVGPHVPPTLVLIAEAEQVEPPIVEHARAFEARMVAHGRPVDVVVLPNRRHITALRNMADANDPTLAKLIEFARHAFDGVESRIRR